jgi:uncharacterized protein
LLHRVRTSYAKNNKGYTPLIFAASNGNLDIAKYLVEHKANVNVQGNDGATPLNVAKITT